MPILCQEYFLIFRKEIAVIRRVYALFSPVLPNGDKGLPHPVALFVILHNNILCF